MSTNIPTPVLENLAKPVVCKPDDCKPPAYAYSRFSTMQQQEGDSRRRQESMVAKWPEAKNYEIRYLHDPGVSAFQGMNRVIGQFGVFLQSLRSGALGPSPILLVENLDRISREEIETAQMLFLNIIGHGATIITLHNQKRYCKGMGLVDIITALVEMDIAHQHSAKLSMRVREALLKLKLLGGIIHNRSQTPLWLALDEKRTTFTQIPERVNLVRRMFHMADEGIGPDAIARTFNLEGIPIWTHRKKRVHKAWIGGAIHRILRGRTVLGEFEGRAGYFGAAVVDQELWDRVNDKVKRGSQGRGRGVITHANLFVKLVESGVDGSRMILRQSGVKDRKTGVYTWHQYLVSNETRAGRSEHRIKYEKLEECILWLLTNMDPQFFQRSKESGRDEAMDRVMILENHLITVEKQIAKYLRCFRDDDSPPDSLVRELKTLEVEKKNLERLISEAKRQATKVRTVPSVENLDLDRPEHRRIIRAGIADWCDKIILFPDYVVVKFGEKVGIRVPFEGKRILEEINEEQDRDEGRFLMQEDVPYDEIAA